MTEVVSAIIVRNGRILLTQRRADKDFPLAWECPGGKVDGTESHRQAIERELFEELAVCVHSVEKAIWNGEFNNDVTREDRRHISLSMIPVILTIGAEPHPAEGQAGIGWFTPEEMEHLNLAPGNKAALPMILKFIRDGVRLEGTMYYGG